MRGSECDDGCIERSGSAGQFRGGNDGSCGAISAVVFTLVVNAVDDARVPAAELTAHLLEVFDGGDELTEEVVRVPRGGYVPCRMRESASLRGQLGCNLDLTVFFIDGHAECPMVVAVCPGTGTCTMPYVTGF